MYYKFEILNLNFAMLWVKGVFFMIILEEIRKNLIEAIRLSGMTQMAIAQQLNIRQQIVAQYISGKAMPSLDTFANLCVLLDLDANEILNIK